MKASVVSASVGGLVGGLVATLVTWGLRPSAPAPAPVAEGPQKVFEAGAPQDAGASEDDEATLRRLQSLERRLSLLTTAYARRAGETEAGQEPSPSQADGAPRGWSRLSARDSV